MATVGKMVFAESAPFRPEGEDDTAQMGAAMVVERLQSLGIWDAEVLEGVEFLEHGDEAVAFEPPVRVIVLPKEKE